MVKTINTPTHTERASSLRSRWNRWRSIDPALESADNNSNRPGGGTLTSKRQKDKENPAAATMTGASGASGGPASTKTITVNRNAYNKLKEEHKVLSTAKKEMLKDAKETKKEIKSLKEDLQAADDDVEAKASEIAGLQDELNSKDDWISKAKTNLQQQKATIKQLETCLAKNGSAITTNRKEDMVKHVTATAKNYVWRNYKFIEDEVDLVEATTQMIPFLKIPLEMTEEAFIPLYKDVVNAALGEQRTYIQGETKKRCQGTQDCCVCFCFFV